MPVFINDKAKRINRRARAKGKHHRILSPKILYPAVVLRPEAWGMRHEEFGAA